MKVDFSNSIINVSHSIIKRFLGNTNQPTILELDEKIKNSKHVFLVLLDGLGMNLLNLHLDEMSFLRKNLQKEIFSVIPPTTVAATTAVLAAKTPIETGYIGWHQYFEEIDEEVTIFKNEGYYTKEKLAFNVESVLKYEPFYTKFKDVSTSSLYPAFKEGGFKNFKQMAKHLLNLSFQENETFAYAYFDRPDSLIHEFGVTSKKVKRTIKHLDKVLEKTFKKMNESTSLIVIADHGLVDVRHDYIKNYKELDSLLLQKPSLEGRFVSFKVKDKEKFKKVFKECFPSFLLFSHDEVIKEGFLGCKKTPNERFIGDFVAAAKGDVSISYEKQKFEFKAAHAGLTKDEMMVPLIVVTK